VTITMNPLSLVAVAVYVVDYCFDEHCLVY
jgi:hypothetical protein